MTNNNVSCSQGTNTVTLDNSIFAIILTIIGIESIIILFFFIGFNKVRYYFFNLLFIYINYYIYVNYL